MQKLMAKIGVYLVVGLILVSGSMVLGGFLYKKFFDPTPAEQRVTALTVVDRISTEGMLVTRSLYAEEDVTITIDQGSAWSNFWWGHEVTAKAPMRTDLGIDLSKLSEEDITVNEATKTITIDLPPVEIAAITLEGDIEVERESGIFYSIFEEDENEDYNLALAELKTAAQATVEADTDLYEETKASVVELLNFLFADVGYTVVSD